MECNKDEAIRAKEIAEKKFAEKDIMSAKKFAQKAQNLYPGLEEVSQMLTILDVYIAAENKIDGDADWYGILGVNPQADDETVRKQYRKLALLLHPDKNKSVGAEGAFKFISEAWIFLSDKGKKQAYDRKRRTKGSTSGGGFSASPGANGFHNIAKNASPSERTKKNSTRAGFPLAPSSQKQKSNTFWTVCKRCKVQYEYLRVYLNHNLLCPNCKKPFLATETSPPHRTTSRRSTTWSFSHQHQNSQRPSQFASDTQRDNTPAPNNRASGHSSSESFNSTSFQWSPFSKTSGPASAAQAATIVRRAYEQVKREREEAQTTMRREEALQRKRQNSNTHNNVAKRRRGLAEVQGYSSARVPANSESRGNDGTNSAKFNMDSSVTNQVKGAMNTSYTKDLSWFSFQNALREKARLEIRKILDDCNFSSKPGTAVKEDLMRCEKADEGGTSGTGGDIYAEYNLSKSIDMNNGVCCKSFGDNSDDAYAETLEAMSVSVEDPDFHDFDKDRTESSFQENQVWAAYDNDDGMPRYYAMIHKVISLSPFRMQFSRLKSVTDYELGPWNWVGFGFSKTCGEFRVRKHKITGSLTSFSHKVKWTKGAGGVIQIYPKAGEVWALYRNWSPDWNELTADEVIHKYDMVEILEEYREEHGVTFVPLIKVAGFKTVFRRHLNPGEVRRIPRAEMFRFSHQVPSDLIVDQGSPSALRGCIDLDPAAIPLELLQVTVDVKEVKLAEVEEFITEQNINDRNVKDAAMSYVENSEKLNNEQKGALENITTVKIVEDS